MEKWHTGGRWRPELLLFTEVEVELGTPTSDTEAERSLWFRFEVPVAVP